MGCASSAPNVSDSLASDLQRALCTSEDAIRPLAIFLGEMGATQLDDLRGLDSDDTAQARDLLPKLKRPAFDDLVAAMKSPTAAISATLAEETVVATVISGDDATTGPRRVQKQAGTNPPNQHVLGSGEWRRAWQKSHREGWDAFVQLREEDVEKIAQHNDQIKLMRASASMDVVARGAANKEWWAPYWKEQSGMPRGGGWDDQVQNAEELPAVVNLTFDSDLDDLLVDILEVQTDWHAKRFVLAEIYDEDKKLIHRERFDALVGEVVEVKTAGQDPNRTFSYFIKLPSPISNPSLLSIVLDGVLCGVNFNVVIKGIRALGVRTKLPVTTVTTPTAKEDPTFDLECVPSLSSSSILRVTAHASSGGRYFCCLHADLEASAGLSLGTNWAAVPSKSGVIPTIVKGGEGGVMRARNLRTAKEGAVLVWWDVSLDVEGKTPSSVVGCWNPAEFSSTDDWADDDELELLDAPSPQGMSRVAVASALLKSKTGWNLNIEHLAFGESGVVGDFWKGLEVVFTLDGAWTLVAVRTDCIKLPFSLFVKRQNKKGWEKVATDLRGPIAAVGSLNGITTARLCWASTDMFQLSGLSTARSGGGLHADLWGHR